MKKYLIFSSLLLILACKGRGEKHDATERNIISGTFSFRDSMLIYATWDSTVVVENLASKKKSLFKTKNLCYAKPILAGDKLLFPVSDSEFNCVDIFSRKLLWKAKLGGRCSSFTYANGCIIANTKHNGITGLDSENGDLRFLLPYQYDESCLLPDLSPYPILVDRDIFYICNWQCKSLSAFNMLTGVPIWSKQFGNGLGNFVLANDVIFYGRNDGYKTGGVMLIDASTATVLCRNIELFEERVLPLMYKNRIYYYTYDSKLREMDLSTKQSRVVFSFNDSNNVSGSQMFLYHGKLYYSKNGSVYSIDLKDFRISKILTNSKDILGGFGWGGKISFAF